MPYGKRIIQIMPAEPGWSAHFKAKEGDDYDLPVIGWALYEELLEDQAGHFDDDTASDQRHREVEGLVVRGDEVSIATDRTYKDDLSHYFLATDRPTAPFVE